MMSYYTGAAALSIREKQLQRARLSELKFCKSDVIDTQTQNT